MPKKVTIYSTPTCVYCRMAKDFFKNNNVEYQEVNVAEDAVARDMIIEKSHQRGVPVIDIDGELFVGFNRAVLAKALGLATRG